MDAVQQWCYDNQYYLKDFVTEAIEAKLKTRGSSWVAIIITHRAESRTLRARR